MKLVEFVPPVKHPLWKLCLQMGITDVIIKVNPDLTGLSDPWKYETLSKIVGSLKAEGLTVVGLEGDPFDMSPIKEYSAATTDGGLTGTTDVPSVGTVNGQDARCPSGSRAHGGSGLTGTTDVPSVDGQGLTGTTDVPSVGTVNGQDARCPSGSRAENARELALAHYRELLESMSRLGIKLLCYNFMVGKGWSRTGVREVRGGAKATYFRVESGELRVESGELLLDHDQVWANYEYFIKAVMPTAERCGVRMGLHPDDPCLPSLGGYARIFGSVEAYDRAYEIYPSPSNAVTFCQANFKLMDVDLIEAARHFGKRIAFIHIRDVEGDKTDFTELFHDQGTTDQFALMRVYRELGLDVPVRGDHVPEMEGDRKIVEDAIPGYFTLGRLFANGYLKALLACP